MTIRTLLTFAGILSYTLTFGQDREKYSELVEKAASLYESKQLPLDHPDNVDKRRSDVGLGKLKDYISIWGLIWDVDAYKRKLPGIEAKRKR